MGHRTTFWAVGAVGAALVAAGCEAPWGHLGDDCDGTLTCVRHDWLRYDGRTPPACVPSENASAVDDACGAFVSASGSDESAATKAAPVKTLRAALALAEENRTRRVYACAEAFDEAVEVTQGVTIYGGLDCANGWGWVGEQRKTELAAGAGEIPLVVRGGGGEASVRVEDVHVQARGIEREDGSLAGMSSIAAVAEEARVALARCVLEAGDAAPGADGAAYETRAKRGEDGKPGGDACSADRILPGLSMKNDCGTPDDASDDSYGGSGGSGEVEFPGDGDHGSPCGATNGRPGEANGRPCYAGIEGVSPRSGNPGTGATGLGDISASGYVGVAGRDGAKGRTAQGGGGGGGAAGGAGAGKCPSTASAGGASGGSGGAGGCGGAGGRGGGAGGASIALISLNATLRFEQVTLKTGRGGAGGKGGEGQEGGEGGAGGRGGEAPVGAALLHDGCAGGPGGKGGPGGPAGGGRGGHAIGIAYKGKVPSTQGATIEVGEAGPGGPGALALSFMQGAAGVKAEVQAF
ncbi:PGRS family protein [Sorangium sp. So ce1153]|uniref:PGRS family protein n=1 Tax=Sorangium sp. So ce1153 TaxID=3133333 RepID=UPI003F5E456F